MKKPLSWVPWHVDSWLYGSSRLELTRAQRSDFLDLVLLSAKDSGFVRANEVMGYPLTQLGGMLNIKPEELEETIERCVAVGKITRHESGILHITNYDLYRLGPRYRRKLEHGSGSSDSSSSKEIKKRKEEESKPGRKSGPVFRKSGTGPPPPGKKDLDKDGLLPVDGVPRGLGNEPLPTPSPGPSPEDERALMTLEDLMDGFNIPALSKYRKALAHLRSRLAQAEPILKENNQMRDSTAKEIICCRCGKETLFYTIAPYGSVDDGDPICAKCLDISKPAPPQPSEEEEDSNLGMEYVDKKIWPNPGESDE